MFIASNTKADLGQISRPKPHENCFSVMHVQVCINRAIPDNYRSIYHVRELNHPRHSQFVTLQVTAEQILYCRYFPYQATHLVVIKVGRKKTNTLLTKVRVKQEGVDPNLIHCNLTWRSPSHIQPAKGYVARFQQTEMLYASSPIRLHESGCSILKQTAS